MKKWYDEEYEFTIEVTGFLHGDHTERYCRNGEEIGISDCVTSYDLKKMPEMLSYYADKGCEVKTLAEYMESN